MISITCYRCGKPSKWNCVCNTIQRWIPQHCKSFQAIPDAIKEQKRGFLIGSKSAYICVGNTYTEGWSG